jgi:2-oxoglutarate dehydrogenase E2 component (dihydrolipoamide succinyltransferase)
MAVDVIVPELGESIREVQIVQWLKREGETVAKDEALVEIDTEKATLQIPSPAAGRVAKIVKGDGQFANVGEVIGGLDVVEQAGDAAAQTTDAAAVGPREEAAPAVDLAGPAAPPEKKLAPPTPEEPAEERNEEIVPMSMIRRHIAERLVEAQHQAALLTTFNEVDLSAVIEVRKKHRDRFQEKYGVKLGFMAFFVKAAVQALKQFPQINAQVRDRDIVYHKRYDIGVAIGGGKGLVVPVLRDAGRMSFAQIELAIEDFAQRARENRVAPEELEGGTFTISNGGIYGSLLSTPIVNPPQSGILGLHAIQDRPVARNGQVVIRPMMYLALTYDHRIVDGREAVTFLRTIKETIEDPMRLILEV